MITQGLNQTIKKIPKSLFDWLNKRENGFPEIEFQVYFSAYKSDDDKKAVIKYEFIYGEMPHLRHVFFPRPDGIWNIKIIGNQNRVILASGIVDLMESGKLEELYLSGKATNLYRGYIGLSGNLHNEEMIEV